MCARSSLPVGGETIVQVRDLGVTYPERAQAAPDGVTFDLHTGEVALLLGPSGAGKSTLALTLDGLIPHEVSATIAGSVTVAGTDVAGARVAQMATDVAMVFQDSDAQIVAATVLDEVCFGLENLQRPREEILRSAERALRRVDLWDRRRDDPGDLSGGGRQRLAIACALALGSRAIVLDEPTANLDPQGVVDVYTVLSEIAADRSRAILLIEHNLDEAMSVVDRVIVLDAAGRVRFDGPTRGILENHAGEIDRLGVWLPVSTVAGRRLGVRPLPLTPAELTAAVDAGVASGALPAEPRTAAQTVTAGLALGPDGAGAVLDVRHLSAYAHGRDQPLVDRVSLQVPRGSLTAIVGRNGAGKTTLLHRLAGVVSPPRGSVRIHSDRGMLDVATASPRRLAREVGFVFQNPEHQFITPTVGEELAHGLHLQGLGEPEIEARVTAMLRRLGLEDLREVHPYLLSGGQKRRLSVGTALIAGAPVLCLDEPTYGQDQARAAELVALLAELVNAGSTVVIVTHDMQLVTEQSTHVAVMNDGRLEAFGPTTEVLAGDALERAGLLRPPLARAMSAVVSPAWHGITRLQQIEQLQTGVADEDEVSAPTVANASRPSAPLPLPSRADAASVEKRQRRRPRPRPRPTTTSMFDPAVPASDRPRWAPLATLNPVAKLIAMLPLTVVALALRDIGALLGALTVVLLVVIVGSGAGWRRLIAVIGGIVVGISVLSVSVGLWMDPAAAEQQQTLWQLGDWRFTTGMWLTGLGVTLRVGTVAALGMLPGLTATGVDTIRALVRRLHVPYRLGYTALAAYRFVPRFGHELEQIRRAHRVRGVSNGRGPIAVLRRAAGYALPLLASGIRHAERVALSMDARAFGAGSARTERYEVPWRMRDWAFVVGFWALVVAGLLIGASLLPISV